MARVENKCTNCSKLDICKLAAATQVVIWKHCDKFKPTRAAIERAIAAERKERAAEFFAEYHRVDNF